MGYALCLSFVHDVFGLDVAVWDSALEHEFDGFGFDGFYVAVG